MADSLDNNVFSMMEGDTGSIDITMMGRDPVKDFFGNETTGIIMHRDSPEKIISELDQSVFKGARILRGNPNDPTDRYSDVDSYIIDENVVIDINDKVSFEKLGEEGITDAEAGQIFVGQGNGPKYLMGSNA